VNHRAFTARWRVRSYELDSNGHVNNSVYVAYAEELASLHAETLGFGRVWAQEHGAAWVVSKHEIAYRRPANFGDDLELTTTVISMRGARAVRHTSIKRVDGPLLAEGTTEWVWVRATDGRPMRLPAALLHAFSDVHC
jgi:acyl-CoA thioester hydrolase